MLALLIAGSVQAQSGTYAVNSKSSSTTGYYANRVNAVVRIMQRTERQIALTWAPFQGAVSHYVLERSTDGRSYHEAGVFFTGEWDQEPLYTYVDKFKKPYTGPLFYRLKVVGLDATEVYTLPSLSEAK